LLKPTMAQGGRLNVDEIHEIDPLWPNKVAYGILRGRCF
jgi:hypothetical protein